LKQAKKINIFLLSGLLQSCAHGYGLVTEVKIIAETVDNLTEKVTDTLYNNAVSMSKALGADAAKSLGSDAVEKLVPSVDHVARAGVAIAGTLAGTYAIGQLYCVAKDVKETMNPSDEQKASAMMARANIKYHQAKDELITCFFDNNKGLRNSDGYPSICEQKAGFFALVAGHAALREKIEDFKYGYKN